MAATPEVRSWDGLFAARTRGGVGDGIAAVLAFLGIPEMISFAGGFPDPRTFPREQAATLLREFGQSLLERDELAALNLGHRGEESLLMRDRQAE